MRKPFEPVVTRDMLSLTAGGYKRMVVRAKGYSQQEYPVADLAGEVDLFAGDADVGDGSLGIPIENTSARPLTAA